MLESNTQNKIRHMDNMREFIGSVRKGLETFSTQITYATLLYKRKTAAPAETNNDKSGGEGFFDLEQESMVTEATSATYENELFDTMGISIDNFSKVMLNMAKDLRSKADLLFRELIEPSDQYSRHYSATNAILIE